MAGILHIIGSVSAHCKICNTNCNLLSNCWQVKKRHREFAMKRIDVRSFTKHYWTNSCDILWWSMMWCSKIEVLSFVCVFISYFVAKSRISTTVPPWFTPLGVLFSKNLSYCQLITPLSVSEDNLWELIL